MKRAALQEKKTRGRMKYLMKRKNCSGDWGSKKKGSGFRYRGTFKREKKWKGGIDLGKKLAKDLGKMAG